LLHTRELFQGVLDSRLDHIGLSENILNVVRVLSLVLLWLLDILTAHMLELTEELASILWHWLLRLCLWLVQILLLVVLVAHVLQLTDELATGGPVVLQPLLHVVVVVRILTGSR
jgi:hypothetical protein